MTGTAYANFDANFYDIDTGEQFWVSGPKRDQTDGRDGHQQPVVAADVKEQYECFLAGSALPGRARG